MLFAVFLNVCCEVPSVIKSALNVVFDPSSYIAFVVVLGLFIIILLLAKSLLVIPNASETTKDAYIFKPS